MYATFSLFCAFTSLPPSPSLPLSLSGHALEDAREFGWEFSKDVSHNWTKMVENIQAHIGSLNWGYRVALRDKNVKYINAKATLQDAHTVKVGSVILWQIHQA